MGLHSWPLDAKLTHAHTDIVSSRRPRVSPNLSLSLSWIWLCFSAFNDCGVNRADERHAERVTQSLPWTFALLLGTLLSRSGLRARESESPCWSPPLRVTTRQWLHPSAPSYRQLVHGDTVQVLVCSRHWTDANHLRAAACFATTWVNLRPPCIVFPCILGYTRRWGKPTRQNPCVVWRQSVSGVVDGGVCRCNLRESDREWSVSRSFSKGCWSAASAGGAAARQTSSFDNNS